MAIKDDMEDVQEAVINELITENGITNTLADDQVTETKILNNAVTTNKIDNGAVTPQKLSQSYLPLTGGSVSGNVGIGTTTPDLKLDVSHGTGSEYVATFQNTADNLELKIGTVDGLLNIQGANASSNAVYQIALNAEGGNVGIGRSGPLSIFEVHMNTNKNIGFSGAQGELGNVPAIVAYNDAGSLADIGFRGTTVRFATASAERMRINSQGHVILSNVPTSPSTLATGTIYSDGGTLKIV